MPGIPHPGWRMKVNPNVPRSRTGGITVDRECRNHGQHPATFRRDEYIECPGHVRLVRGKGILHRPGHGSDGRLVEDAVRAGEGLHQEVEVSDAPLDEGHPGVIQEVLDIHLLPNYLKNLGAISTKSLVEGYLPALFAAFSIQLPILLYPSSFTQS